MTGQQLKNSILQWAIEGKLVPQIESEGTAEDLLKEIRAEKERLVKEGKLKKKDLDVKPIEDDEIPFEIPEGWRWCRLGEISNIWSARRVHEKDWRSSGIPFFRAREIGKLASEGTVDNELFIDKELYDEFSKSGLPQANDLMLTAVGTLGKAYIVKESDVFYYKDGSVLCLNNFGHLNPIFLKYAIESSMFVKQYQNESEGTTVSTLTIVRMNGYMLPIPPLAEQKRIVSKIEELMPLVEEYGKAQERLETLNRELPDKLKKSVLQEAIMGKLVPQDPTEGTAEELLAEIRKEKEKLVKEGKLKKKDLEVKPIEVDEIPFEIPEGWKWCRYCDVFRVINGDRGKNYPSKDKLSNTGIPFVSALNLSNNSIAIDDRLLCVSEKQFDLLGSGKINKGDTLVCIRGSLGKHGIYPLDRGAIASSLVICRSFYSQNYLSSYLSLYLDSELFKEEIRKYDNGTAQPNLAAKSLEEFLFPLPPLSEQKRIVAKLEEVMEEIEGMK